MYKQALTNVLILIKEFKVKIFLLKDKKLFYL